MRPRDIQWHSSLRFCIQKMVRQLSPIPNTVKTDIMQTYYTISHCIALSAHLAPLCVCSHNCVCTQSASTTQHCASVNVFSEHPSQQHTHTHTHSKSCRALYEAPHYIRNQPNLSHPHSYCTAQIVFHCHGTGTLHVCGCMGVFNHWPSVLMQVRNLCSKSVCRFLTPSLLLFLYVCPSQSLSEDQSADRSAAEDR